MPYNKYKFVKFLLVPFILFFLLFSYLQLQVILMGNSFKPANSDAIVVLGHSLDKNYNPSPWLTARLEKALKLYNENYASTIIVSGGIGPRDTIPVARGMQKWLLNNGVPYESILMETNSNNTYENLMFTKQLAYYHDISSIIVVTNDFHMYRSMYIANMFFNEVSGSAAYVPFNFNKLRAYIKEPLSIIKYTVVHSFNTLI